MSLKIKHIAPDSIARELGLQPGDRLLKIDGHKVRDHLDYRFRFREEQHTLEIEIQGVRQLIDLEKDEDTDLGVEFEDFAIRSCANDCVFCFVDQNPDGRRKELYFRDGDYRLSFLYGHYITLTNMGPKDLARVVEQRLTPLYVSIHATDPEVRRRLLRYPKDDPLLDKMRFLLKGGIKLHGQIVLCPGFNDKEVLLQTLRDLHPLSPGLRSVAIVPLGLTGHREGLTYMAPVTKDYAVQFMADMESLDRQFRHADATRFIYLSDEWFIKVGRDVPPMDYYHDQSIIENGVGQVREFIDQFQQDQKKLPLSLLQPQRWTIATGVLAGGIFEQHVAPRLNEVSNLEVKVITVPNSFLGPSVTVAGLLSGVDLISSLSAHDLGDRLLVTDRILNDSDGVTLDDMTPAMIGDRLGTPLQVMGDGILEMFGISNE